MPFFRGDRDAFWQLSAEDFVLDLQLFHLPGQLFLGRAGDHQQQRLKNVRHRSTMQKEAVNLGDAFILAPWKARIAWANIRYGRHDRPHDRCG